MVIIVCLIWSNSQEGSHRNLCVVAGIWNLVKVVLMQKMHEHFGNYYIKLLLHTASIHQGLLLGLVAGTLKPLTQVSLMQPAP